MRSMALKDLCVMKSGGTPSRKNPSFYEGEIPWAKISDLEFSPDGYIHDTKEHITQWHQKRRQQETPVKVRRSSKLNAQSATQSPLTELDQCSRILSEPLLEPKKVSDTRKYF